MKPFNLEEALAGKPVITRNGREVTQLHLFKAEKDLFPLIGVIDEEVICWSIEGKFLERNKDNNDLFMFVEKKSVWVNVYEDSTGSLWVQSCVSKEVADRLKSTSEKFNKYIKTIEITNEV